jgi:HK97 family phage major capsid protein
MKAEDFLKLPKEQQDALIAKMEDVQAVAKKIADQETGSEKPTMAQFEEKIKGVMEGYMKGMTNVDKKFFVFPGIGDNAKINDDVSGEGKFRKTKMFLSALLGKDAKVLNQMHAEVATKANLSEGTTTAGGFLVPEEFKAEILRLAPLYGVIRKEARIIPMMSDICHIPAAGSQDITTSWVNEAATIASTDPNFRQVTLTINKLATIPKVTNELLADANVPVIQYLSELIAEAFAKEEDNQAFLGTGSPFTGILAATGVPVSTHAGGAIALSYGDLMRMTGELYTNAKGNAKWYFHRTMRAHVQGLITTAGAPIFGASASDLGGYPIVDVEILRNRATATGTKYGVYGDLRRGFAMGERGSMTMKITEEGTVGGDNLFEKDMAALRVIERIAQAVVLPSSFLTIQG